MCIVYLYISLTIVGCLVLLSKDDSIATALMVIVTIIYGLVDTVLSFVTEG